MPVRSSLLSDLSTYLSKHRKNISKTYWCVFFWVSSIQVFSFSLRVSKFSLSCTEKNTCYLFSKGKHKSYKNIDLVGMSEDEGGNEGASSCHRTWVHVPSWPVISTRFLPSLNLHFLIGWMGDDIDLGVAWGVTGVTYLNVSHEAQYTVVSSFASAENSSWIVYKPLRCTGQICNQGGLLNNTVYLHSGKIEIIMLWLAGAIYRHCPQSAVGIRDLPNKFTNSPAWP